MATCHSSANQIYSRWGEWLQLPILYSSLPLDSVFSITVWDLSPGNSIKQSGSAVPFGGTTLPVFDQDNQLLKGRQKCVLYRNLISDATESRNTPALSRQYKKSIEPKSGAARGPGDEIERMEALFKKHELGEISRVDWLDQMVFRGFEKTVSSVSGRLAERRGTNDLPVSNFLLNIELPRFDFPVVFSDKEYYIPPVSTLQPSVAEPGMEHRAPHVHFGPGINATGESSDTAATRIIDIFDPEIGQRDNPAEAKHRRLFRSSHRHGILDKDLKPNAKVRDDLNTIMTYSPTHILTSEETDLVWKFRYHLTKDKRALTKFVKSVNWNDHGEAKEAVRVLDQWTKIDIDDALEILGPSFGNPAVRSYAVRRLEKAGDEELLLYLLQLVQALKYERLTSSPDQAPGQGSTLANFLIQRATADFTLGNYFYWYLMVECDDGSSDQGSGNRTMYRKVAYTFMVELVKQPHGSESRATLLRQAELISTLSKIASEVKLSNDTIVRNVDRVKAYLSDPKHELVTMDPPLALPLDPSVLITGIDSNNVTLFKSSLTPIKFTFKTTNGGIYPIIFKVGDDLRQDQLVVQIITLMDQLLQKENLDLKLLPYKILATSTTAGASQFIQSQSLSSIVAKFKTNPALAYLKYHNPDDTQSLGVRQEVIDTYVRSCAGYCVITYILGVGDRHLDNLLLAPDGHFFHADFGYILGRDPKPFAPMMKLSKEMVDCMGGVQSEYYKMFRQYCFLAYTALRKSSNLILNLFSLMVDANIPDIRIEPDKAVLKVRERFHLELTEEEAILYFGRVIDDNLTAFAPVVIDKLHEWAQAFRS